MGALDGLTVIDVSTLFAGPMAAMHLGDMGAAVIKVEHPTRPDPARGHGPSKDGQNLWWKTLGRNKRTIALDLHTDGGREALLQAGRDRRRRDRELPPGDAGAVGPRLRRPRPSAIRASSSPASPDSGRRGPTGRDPGSARSPRR